MEHSKRKEKIMYKVDEKKEKKKKNNNNNKDNNNNNNKNNKNNKNKNNSKNKNKQKDAKCQYQAGEQPGEALGWDLGAGERARSGREVKEV